MNYNQPFSLELFLFCPSRHFLLMLSAYLCGSSILYLLDETYTESIAGDRDNIKLYFEVEVRLFVQ
jgi:hypothetical protein